MTDMATLSDIEEAVRIAHDAYYNLLHIRNTQRSAKKRRAAERTWQESLADRNAKLKEFYGEGSVTDLLRRHYDDTVIKAKRPRRRPSA